MVINMYNTEEIVKNLKMLFAPMITEMVQQAMAEYSKSATTEQPTYSRKDFAKRMGVSPQTLWRWEKHGLLKGTRIGQQVYYRDSDLKLY